MTTDPTGDRPSLERDRDDLGRPQQTRPRDRTGRPLPRGTTGVATTEDHQPATVGEALDLGRRLWGEERFFEAHECLEFVWHAVGEDDANLWQGVIQIAVAAVHLQRGNPAGAITLLERSVRRLTGLPDVHHGIAVRDTVVACERLRTRLVAGERVAASDVPGFPAAGPRVEVRDAAGADLRSAPIG